MPFVITDPCIGTKDTACVDVCPVDCIHPRKDEPEFDDRADALHPSRRVHRLRRVRAGVSGRRPSTTASTRRPSSQKELVTANSVYRSGEADAVAKAVAIVQGHIDTHAELMTIDPKDRQAKH